MDSAELRLQSLDDKEFRIRKIDELEAITQRLELEVQYLRRWICQIHEFVKFPHQFECAACGTIWGIDRTKTWKDFQFCPTCGEKIK